MQIVTSIISSIVISLIATVLITANIQPDQSDESGSRKMIIIIFVVTFTLLLTLHSIYGDQLTNLYFRF